MKWKNTMTLTSCGKMCPTLGNNSEPKQTIICCSLKRGPDRGNLEHLEIISLQSLKKECGEIILCTLGSFRELGGKILR